MKKYTFTIAVIGFILFAVTRSELWFGVAIGSLLLTPIIQGVVNGWQGKPKEKIEARDGEDEDDFLSVFDPLPIHSDDPTVGSAGSFYDKDGWLR